MRIFDSHCHLHDDRISENTDALINDAVAKGVAGFLSCASGQSNWEKVLSFSQKYHQIIPAFGVHPWYTSDAERDWFETLKKFLTQTPSIVGEIGLDHGVRDRDDRIQEEFFTRQLELAIEYGLPVNMHCRRAWERCVEILSSYGTNSGIIIHSYSGSAEFVDKLLDLGVYFSFSGSLTRSGNVRAHKALKKIPLERILIETDAPDIMPVIDGILDTSKLNVPSNILYVLNKVAQIKEKDVEEMADITWNNACRILKSVIEKRGFNV